MAFFENLNRCLGSAQSFNATLENYKNMVFPELKNDVLSLAGEKVRVSALPKVVRGLVKKFFNDDGEAVSVRSILNKLGLEEFLRYIDSDNADELLKWYQSSKGIQFNVKKFALLKAMEKEDKTSLEALFNLFDNLCENQ